MDHGEGVNPIITPDIWLQTESVQFSSVLAQPGGVHIWSNHPGHHLGGTVATMT